jgi:L-threonylcarbamoyladenylate synthase
METSLLLCEPLSISFPAGIDSASEPTITSPSTLQNIQTASNYLNSTTETVVFPTETVYGLGASALVPAAVARIFAVKGRPSDNPLIVHVSSLPMLRDLLPKDYSIPPIYQKLIAAFWPGPLTLLFPAEPSIIPSVVTAGHKTVAIRMPSHPVARALIALSKAPLAAPSANSSGKPSPTKAEHVSRDLGGKVRYILDGGACDVGLESTVIDIGESLDGPVVRVLRPGGVTVEDIERVLSEDHDDRPIPKVLVHRRDFRDAEIESAPTTPGMKYRHYAPSVPVILLQTVKPSASEITLQPEPLAVALRALLDHISRPSSPSPSSRALNGSTRKALKIGLLAPEDSTLSTHVESTVSSLSEELHISHKVAFHALGRLSDPAETAHRLFDGLLTLEEEGADMILIEGIEEEREGLAVMNRVRKAASEVRWIDLDEEKR